MPENRRTVSLRELSEMLGVHAMLIYRLCKDGRIPSLKLGERIVIPLVVVEQMLANPTSLSKGEPSIMTDNKDGKPRVGQAGRPSNGNGPEAENKMEHPPDPLGAATQAALDTLDPAADVIESVRLIAAWRNGAQPPEELAQGALLHLDGAVTACRSVASSRSESASSRFSRWPIAFWSRIWWATLARGGPNTSSG